MQIPVLLTELCSGTGPDDPEIRVHGAFTTEAAARNVMKAVIGEKGAGTLILAPDTDVFIRQRSAVIESDFGTAIAAGHAIDYTRLAYQAPKDEEPAPDPKEDAAPVDVIANPEADEVKP